jgi:hypothetical protein
MILTDAADGRVAPKAAICSFDHIVGARQESFGI